VAAKRALHQQVVHILPCRDDLLVLTMIAGATGKSKAKQASVS
jgi:hypothetical protein